MSSATAPAFWAPQARWPLPLQAFVRGRMEAALEAPDRRVDLVWPTVLGSPRLWELHPEGMSESELFSHSGRMLAALGVEDPAQAWRESLARFPDTAEKSGAGWRAHSAWAAFHSRASLRCGVGLLALTGQPLDDRYRLGCAVTLFNSALFYECHEALEGLWVRSEGDLKRALQGLILLAAGFHQQQHGEWHGMKNLWRDGLRILLYSEGEVPTPWGTVQIGPCLDAVEQRLEWMRHGEPEAASQVLWELPRPEWNLGSTQSGA